MEQRIKRDWKICQGDKDIEFGYQAKFDYIIKQKKNVMSLVKH